MTVGKRLVEERTRLEMSQEALAGEGGVTKRAQIRYEQDERSPDVDYLQGIAKGGVDVGYVITGERRLPVHGSEREQAMLIKAIEDVAHKAGLALPAGGAEQVVHLVRDAYQGAYDVESQKGASPGRSLSPEELRLLSNYERCNATGKKAIERTAQLEAERQKLKKKVGESVLNNADVSIRGDNNTVGSRNNTSK